MSHSDPQISQAEQAAQAIIDLINSRPQSPTKDELVAIIIAKTAEDIGARAGEGEDGVADGGPTRVEMLQLPFVAKGADGKLIFWKVEASGDWCADCEVGEAYTHIFLERIRAHQPRPTLGFIVGDMVRAGPVKWSGVEAGFLSYIERAAARRLMTLW